MSKTKIPRSPRLALRAGVGVLNLAAALLVASCDCDEGPIGPEPYKSIWEFMPTPEGNGAVADIYMFSASNGWAACRDEVWRWNGTEWKVQKKFGVTTPDTLLGLQQLWFNSANDGWLTGFDVIGPPPHELHARMWHYDGSNWAEVVIPEVHTIYKLWFNAPDDGWAIGGDYALRWDGSSWNLTTFPTPGWLGCYFFSPNDGWATSYSNIWRWDGSSWTLSYTSDGQPRCIGFAAPTNGWALGEGPYTRGWHWDGSSWKIDDRWDYLKYNVAFNDVSFSRADYGWAVGNLSYFWDGKTWTKYDLPQWKNGEGLGANCVYVLNDEAWIGVAGYNVIVRFKGIPP